MKNLTLQRIAAIDVFRALTMFLMLFVNDIPGLRNIPHWLLHAEYNEDMLGFSDTIFPAFLFCMGMSISFAVQGRIKKGDSLLQVGMHIFWRTVALIVMGLFTVNYGSLDPVATGMTVNVYCILMVIGFFLVWAVYPKVEDKKKKYLFIGMKAIGVALLVFLFLIYEGRDGVPFGPKWWGILGLIGWTYVICAVIYLFTRESLVRNAVVWVIFIVLMLLNHAKIISLSFIPSDFTLHIFGFSGVLTSLLMQKYADTKKPWKFISILCALGVVMLIGALISHPHWIISKIQATPTWFFYCMAAFFPLFGFFYWLTDVKQKQNWFDIIKPAGTATLTCYVLPYIWYSVMSMLHIGYPDILNSGIPGLLRSMVFSLLIVWITGLLVKGKIKLKI
ncbi:DUF5009 domain-containing protein [Bacteroides sp. 51]|uniref:DUF5009 domain-containing protein n=1 Tax=Bacteroides sp. 51 TaxID=2302938 RepID=UPI0013D1617E|nr:DUF5009 domain-containing protein [Bacteroides sp. 51]NDV80493.1 DUF5009 domain-containing protein [Bacteroides sp. 51]